MPDRPIFTVREANFEQEFEFVLDEEKRPIKLGDGTFGVVYKVKSKEDEFAVKLLYQDSDKSNFQLFTLDTVATKRFIKQSEIHPNNNVSKILNKLCKSSFTLSNLLFTIQGLNLSQGQFDYIAKRLLKPKEDDSKVKDRYKYERDASKEIKHSLRKRDRSSTDAFAGVIDIKAGIDDFRSSDAFLFLEKHFEDEQIEVSNFAIIMPLYKFTLKDLLERTTGNFIIKKSVIQEIMLEKDLSSLVVQGLKGQVFRGLKEVVAAIDNIEVDDKYKTILKNNIYELNGYDLLKSMGYDKRIATILPYLIDISQGLRALHLVNRFHYDLKPSNIFVKLEGEQVRSVIGDLGFLMIPDIQIQHTLNTSTKDLFPLGTRHYRSPEQKDYFDICDAEITGDGFLIIRDPKFADTIIEEGDFAVLSKDKSKTKHFIKEKTINREYIKIELYQPENNEHKLKHDPKTQVVFYKQQHLRTDLFGFGAIVFDLITGGKSPERFYDKIRSFDTEEKNVDKILENYEQVSTYQVTDPELLHVFSDFKSDEAKDYAPKEIVELIIKCMMYKAKETYYQNFLERKIKIQGKKEQDQHKPGLDTSMGLIFNRLKEFDKKYHAIFFGNHLIQKSHPGIDPLSQSHLLIDKIKELQSLDITSLFLRLAQGFWYFKELVALVRITLRDKNNSTFFCELLPTNIIVGDSGLDFLFITYKNENDYKEDLADDLVYAKITRDITNLYVPNYLTFFRRKIELTPISIKENRFKYIFLESALLGNEIEVGDWIIIDKNRYKITYIKDNELSLAFDQNQQKKSSKNENLFIPSTEENSEKPGQHIFYKNIDPCYYYLHLLGIYLYNIFFVGYRHATNDKPLLITIAQSARFLSNLPEPVKIEDYQNGLINREDQLEDLYRFITQMYLKLIFTSHKKSYFNTKSDDESRILALTSDVRKLQDKIEELVEVSSNRLDFLIPGFKHQEKQTHIPKLSAQGNAQIGFDDLVRRYMHVSIDKVTESNNYSTKNKINRGLLISIKEIFSALTRLITGVETKMVEVDGEENSSIEIDEYKPLKDKNELDSNHESSN